MLAEGTGPCFTIFDGSDFESEYPFSCFLSYEDWECEQELMGEWSEEAEV